MASEELRQRLEVASERQVEETTLMRKALDAARGEAEMAASRARAEVELEMAARVKAIEAEYHARQEVSAEMEEEADG